MRQMRENGKSQCHILDIGFGSGSVLLEASEYFKSFQPVLNGVENDQKWLDSFGQPGMAKLFNVDVNSWKDKTAVKEFRMQNIPNGLMYDIINMRLVAQHLDQTHL